LVLFLFNHQIVSVGVCFTELEDCLYFVILVEQIQHTVGLFEKLHGFGGFIPFFFRKSGQPYGTAGIASVNVGDSCETRLEPPCVEKVNPVDVGGDRMYFIR
jgi:hypothetical protein